MQRVLPARAAVMGNRAGAACAPSAKADGLRKQLIRGAKAVVVAPSSSIVAFAADG
jgi:hypothetical protein